MKPLVLLPKKKFFISVDLLVEKSWWVCIGGLHSKKRGGITHRQLKDDDPLPMLQRRPVPRVSYTKANTISRETHSTMADENCEEAKEFIWQEA